MNSEGCEDLGCGLGCGLDVMPGVCLSVVRPSGDLGPTCQLPAVRCIVVCFFLASFRNKEQKIFKNSKFMTTPTFEPPADPGKTMVMWVIRRAIQVI